MLHQQHTQQPQRLVLGLEAEGACKQATRQAANVRGLDTSQAVEPAWMSRARRLA